MPSSATTTVPSSSVTGTIWSANRPSSWAAAAFACEPSENSSSLARERPHRRAIISAPTPGFGRAPPHLVSVTDPAGFAPIRDAPIGTRLIDSTPPATTTSY
ncbi:MAG: hypothetical protein QOG28_2213 [Trebonia sp.]|nr:hypothetical protein [Trebonia sp.]